MKWLIAVLFVACLAGAQAQLSGRSTVAVREDGVYAVHPDATEKLLVARRGIPFRPAWHGWLSPGGRYLVLAEDRGEGVPGTAWLFDRKRSAWRRVSNNSVHFVDWSPGAARMALWTDPTKGELIVSDSAHGRVVYRTRYVEEPCLRWSAPQTFTVALAGRGLVRVDRNGAAVPALRWDRHIVAFRRCLGGARFAILDETGVYLADAGHSIRLPIEVQGGRAMKDVELTVKGNRLSVYTYEYGGEPMSWVEQYWWDVDVTSGNARITRNEWTLLAGPDDQ